MSSNANEKFNPSGERPAGAAKPAVDPATRLSELLAQSLEELTRPFEPARADPARVQPEPAVPRVDPFARQPEPATPRVDPFARQPEPAAPRVDPFARQPEPATPRVDPFARQPEPATPRVDPFARQPEPPPPPRHDPVVPFQPAPARPRQLSTPIAPAPAPTRAAPEAPVVTSSRLDDKALAELEAELFAAAAAAKPAREQPAPAEIPPPPEPAEPVAHVEPAAAAPEPNEEEKPAPEPQAAMDLDAERDQPLVDPFARVEPPVPPEVTEPAATVVPDAPPAAAPLDADAARMIAKVRRLMLFSLMVTFIAVGSVFGFIGYRVFKGEGSSVKTADKLPQPQTGGEMTIAIPRGARVIDSAVAEDRLIITLDVDGRTEVRTFDIKTLQPAARLTFSTTP